MTFVGTQNMDQEFASWLATDFREYRKKSPIKSRVIVSNDHHEYIDTYIVEDHEFIQIKHA